MSHGKVPSQRQLRVGELIRHELAAIFTRGEVNDPVIDRDGITVLEVATTPDLRQAIAFVRPLQPDRDAGPLIVALERHRKYIRGLLAPRLGMKFMPDVRFRYDSSLDAAARIDALLRDPVVARDLAARDPGDPGKR